MAWDRPLYLNAPLISGGRLFASSPFADGALPEGRLGGGGANAATALINSGHHAALYSSVPESPLGDRILKAAQSAGCDTEFVARTRHAGKETLLLIEPSGERVVMGYALGPSADLQSLQAERAKLVPPSSQSIQTLAPDGIFLRSTLPGHERICSETDALVVAHWPQSGSQTCRADILVGSVDDVSHSSNPYAQAQSIAGDQLEWVVLTNGAEGGMAFSATKTLSYVSPATEQIDATGAGDCFAAGLLEALCAGADMKPALSHAAHWGALTAGREGSAVTNAGTIYEPFVGR